MSLSKPGALYEWNYIYLFPSTGFNALLYILDITVIWKNTSKKTDSLFCLSSLKYEKR